MTERQGERIIIKENGIFRKGSVTATANKILKDYMQVNGTSDLEAVRSIARRIKACEDLVHYHFDYTDKLTNLATGFRVYDAKTISIHINIEAYWDTNDNGAEGYHIKWDFSYQVVYGKYWKGELYESEILEQMKEESYKRRGEHRYFYTTAPFQKRPKRVVSRDLYSSGSKYAGELTTKKNHIRRNSSEAWLSVR